MSDIIRCTRCNGTKRIIGLGLLEKECDVCTGIGWVSKTPVEIKIKKRKKMMKEYVHYNDEIAKEICREISSTHLGLRRLCNENPHWPTRKNIHCWLIDHPSFRDQYIRARDYQAEWLAEDALEVAYDGSQDKYIDDKGIERANHELVQRSRLIVDTIKWTTAILKPRVYGPDAVKNDASKEASSKDEIVKALRDITDKCINSI
jgi:hypothetical protein